MTPQSAQHKYNTAFCREVTLLPKIIHLKALTPFFKPSSTQKCVLLLLPSVGCLSFTVQNDVCAEFDTDTNFHTCLLKVENFSVVIESPILRVTSQLLCSHFESLKSL